jgi:hypothetical protein
MPEEAAPKWIRYPFSMPALSRPNWLRMSRRLFVLSRESSQMTVAPYSKQKSRHYLVLDLARLYLGAIRLSFRKSSILPETSSLVYMELM